MMEDGPEEPREPATPFTWVVIVALIIWVLGAATIFLSLYG